MKMENGKYSVYGNTISKSETKKVQKWQNMFKKKFNYDPNETYNLSLEDNPYLGPIFGLKNIVRDGGGEPVSSENGVIISTARMSFGHYRIAMAGVSAARAIPLIKQDKLALFVNLGDHKDDGDWLSGELAQYQELIQPHFTWKDTQAFADNIRSGEAKGLHVFLHDNIFHAVYSTNYLMRVVDVLITKPSELAFYPIPKIFNERVGGHEMWGAIRGAELGDGTVEVRTIPQTLQAIDLLTHENDLMELFCDCIVKNKSIGIYDGAYKCVELATGKKFVRK